jgi:hypothetical protein
VGGACGTHGGGKSVYRVFVGRPEGKESTEKTNIKMDLREKGIDGANWVRLAQNKVQWRAFMNTVMNLRVP